MIKSILLLWAFVFIQGSAAAVAVTNVVYCQDPVTVSREVGWCGLTFTQSYFPNDKGYMAAIDGATVTTLIWAKKYISVHSNTGLTSTHVRPVVGLGCPNGAARVDVCGATMVWRTVTTVSYTIYAPTGNIATMTLGPETLTQRITLRVTVTLRITNTSKVTLRITATVTQRVTAKVTVTNTAKVTLRVVETNVVLQTVTETVTQQVTTSIAAPTSFSTVTRFITVDGTVEPVFETETETETMTETCSVTSTERETVTQAIVTTVLADGEQKSCPAAVTITTSVTYAVGTGGQTTIYTSGPTAGTSTYTSCA